MSERARRYATRRRRAGLVVLGALAAACGTGEQTPRDSVRAPSPVSSVGSAAAASSRPACARTGHWIPCQVRERLTRAGLAPHDTTRPELPALGPAPIVYRLGRGGLAVYLFADSTARARAAKTLDTVKYVTASHGPTMLSQATLIENDNLLGLLFSKNDQQIERVSDALTAGPPQP